MSFQTEMEARFGEENIKKWTNPGPNTNTTNVNTTALDTALVDVQGDFRIYAGVEYDSTDSRMLGIACDRASCYLRMRGTSGGGWEKLWEKTEKELRDLRKVTNANRLTPAKVLINPINAGETDRSFADQGQMSRFGFPGLTQKSGFVSEERFP